MMDIGIMRERSCKGHLRTPSKFIEHDVVASRCPPFRLPSFFAIPSFSTKFYMRTAITTDVNESHHLAISSCCLMHGIIRVSDDYHN